MQRLEVSGAVRPIYVSLGVKRLNKKIHILLSQVYCVWQVVKTPTIISNNSLRLHYSTRIGKKPSAKPVIIIMRNDTWSVTCVSCQDIECTWSCPRDCSSVNDWPYLPSLILSTISLLRDLVGSVSTRRLQFYTGWVRVGLTGDTVTLGEVYSPLLQFYFVGTFWER